MKKTMYAVAATLAASLTLAAGAVHANAARDAIAAAKAEATKAIAGNHNLWRDTEKMITEAETLVGNGNRKDYLESKALADKALDQARNAIKQSMESAGAGPKY